MKLLLHLLPILALAPTNLLCMHKRKDVALDLPAAKTIKIERAITSLPSMIPWAFSHTTSSQVVDCSLCLKNCNPAEGSYQIEFDHDEECVAIRLERTVLDITQCAQVYETYLDAFFYVPFVKGTPQESYDFEGSSHRRKRHHHRTSAQYNGETESITLATRYTTDVRVTKTIFCLGGKDAWIQALVYGEKSGRVVCMVNATTMLILTAQPFTGLEKLADLRYSFK